MYYLGLDVGGTKTHCVIADESGRILGFGAAGTGSYEYEGGLKSAAVENRKAVSAALDDASLSLADIARIGMGVAGADLPEDFEMLERCLYADLFGATPRVFRNDSFAALRGGLRSGTGVVVTCGTGCTCAAKSPSGEETRVGGLGAEFGDACTGTSIGEEGLRCVWRARDGVIAPTAMTEKFVTRSGCGDVQTLFDRMYRNTIRPKDLEPMAQLVFEAAVDGDPAACDILERGGAYLGAMVNAAARRLKMTGTAFDVVTSGSVFKGLSPVLTTAMTKTVQGENDRARTVPAEFVPVIGALLLGMEARAVPTHKFYDSLLDSIGAIERRHEIKLKVG